MKKNENDQNSKKASRFSFRKGGKAIRQATRNVLRAREDYLAEQDVVFTEPLTPAPPEPPKPLAKGGVDIPFLIFALLLVCFGGIMSYSASAVYAQQEYGDSAHFVVRYVLFTLLAVAVTAFFVLFCRPWHWRWFALLAYGASIVLLIVVALIGSEGGGAERWLDLGFITVQPSEVAKMAVVMILALYMSQHQKEISSKHVFGGSFRHGFLIPMCFIGAVCVLIALEKHISGLMIVGMLGVAVMFMAGTRIKWLALLLSIIGMAGVFLILVSDYAQERVELWLHLDQVDPLGAAWQTLQGLYAIGSGGFFGVGLGASRQKFGYVSQPQNDFIFTIICEELGFVGAAVLVVLFALLIWRGIKIGQKAPDAFCALTVWGLIFKIGLQVAMNIAVVTNSMPNTGVALPFFSSGGSAIMMQIFEIGIILSISRYSTQKK